MDKLPYIALAYAWVLIYVPRQIMSREMAKLDGGYDNNNPRAQQAKLEGRGKRATGAHLNGFEAFAPFAAALLAAMQRHADLNGVVGVALAFCAVRTIYVWAYLEDKASARSGAWVLGMLATAALAGLAIVG